MAVAIDAPRTDEAEKNADKEAPGKPEGQQRYLVTQQRVVPASMAIGSQRGNGQGSKDRPFYNIASEGIPCSKRPEKSRLVPAAPLFTSI
ncbi:hypothetical protein EDM52_09395 [Brevibacillus invocatus]|uniref:Uncharacterized protein n=1 Tax=Brevibacillus invocatus TaxID=173959 RepID=A0A3M8CGN5_9BACL|nr:hypothetical protein [Brevibacillus invocatus]RNB74924.1 hypothetical protein EDM52_09395 [Brevibacillus invocatus]